MSDVSSQNNHVDADAKERIKVTTTGHTIRVKMGRNVRYLNSSVWIVIDEMDAKLNCCHELTRSLVMDGMDRTGAIDDSKRFRSGSIIQINQRHGALPICRNVFLLHGRAV